MEGYIQIVFQAIGFNRIYKVYKGYKLRVIASVTDRIIPTAYKVTCANKVRPLYDVDYIILSGKRVVIYNTTLLAVNLRKEKVL